MRTTVLGTGIMGSGMATSLAREGHDVTVWNRSREGRCTRRHGRRFCASDARRGDADLAAVKAAFGW